MKMCRIKNEYHHLFLALNPTHHLFLLRTAFCTLDNYFLSYCCFIALVSGLASLHLRASHIEGKLTRRLQNLQRLRSTCLHVSLFLPLYTKNIIKIKLDPKKVACSPRSTYDYSGQKTIRKCSHQT